MHQTTTVCSDISNYISSGKNFSTCADEVKHHLIRNRIPQENFKFPSRIYKDKRKKTGVIKRFCSREWFHIFDFISYSQGNDGVYCLACVLFPDTSHRRPKKLITEPYRDWKDAINDFKCHAVCAYHVDSMARLVAFKQTHSNPSTRIDATFTTQRAKRIENNRTILKSIIKCLEFCGRQGISLRGHRDDETSCNSSFNMGNFKELLRLRAEAGDEVLQRHLETSARNASYVSKSSQNELLLCIKQFIQGKIVDEVKSQSFGPFYGFQCDEVTDASNWEQLGIVLRYTTNGKPIERLLEFVECEEISGEALCKLIIKSLTDVGLDTQLCRSQTMDGAGNMSGKYSGCAARFTAHSPRTVYHYCSSHDLNLAISKSCQIKEVHIMLDTITQLGIFFKYSPKRSRRLEAAIFEVNARRDEADRIDKIKFKVFCQTRWVEKHTTLQALHDMYEPLLICLEAIGSKERGWDRKAVVDAYGLLKRVTDPLFIVCFQTVNNFFGYMTGLSRKLQGSTLDVLQGYRMVKDVKAVISATRNDENEFEGVFCKAEHMATLANVSPLEPPRVCIRQTQRSNVPASTPKEYFKRTLFFPYVDSLIQQLDTRFGSLAQQSVQALCLLPKSIDNLDQQSVQDIINRYGPDMPDTSTFRQELKLWRHMWTGKQDRPDTITETLLDSKSSPQMYPNIVKILNLMLLTSVTSSSTERANSSLRRIKTSLRSSMGEDRFNALMLLVVHKDISLDLDEIINIYARRNPRRILLENPLSD